LDDDPVTNVVLGLVSFGAWLIFLYLRYMDRVEKLNGREMAWYYAVLIFMSFGVAGPLMIQFGINEYADRARQAQPAQV